MTTNTDPMIGTLAAGRYRVLKQLGEGGMGQVYLAEHVAIEKRVALKVLRAEYASRGEIVTRFQQEAISASRIKHPNVLDVFDFGQLENGCFYLAMEFLEGNDLAEEITRRRVLDAGTGIRVSMQICRALAAAHSNGVVHRDMKPENVFLQRTGDGEEIVKIVDFGIAQLRSKEDAVVETKRRLTRTGMIFGTPEYMAPEQAAGKHADLRADIYAVGIIMYEMFTGAVPFTGETFLGVLTKHLNEPPPSMPSVYSELAISPQLQAAIMRALAKDPDTRYQSMLEFAQAITSTSDAAALGYRPVAASLAEHSMSMLPHAPGTPTAPQFHPPSVPPPAPAVTPAPGRTGTSLLPNAGVTPATLVTAGQVTSAARAETFTGAEANPRPAGRGNGGAIALAAVAVVTLVGSGAFFLANRKGDSVVPAQPEKPLMAPAKIEPALPVATTPASVLAPPTPPPAVAPAASVRLVVTTEPSGATLMKNGAQVCDGTPCEVLVPVNETLEFQATKGPRKGIAKVFAQRDQIVTIKLAPAPRQAGFGGKSKHMCEVEVDGLKILRPCQ